MKTPPRIALVWNTPTPEMFEMNLKDRILHIMMDVMAQDNRESSLEVKWTHLPQ